MVINAMGLVNGARKQKDGISFFGNKIKEGEIIINDYALNLENQDINIKHLFIIYYRKGKLLIKIRTFKIFYQSD